VVWIPNGVDFAAMEAVPQTSPDRSRLDALGIDRNDLVFAYAGIIGHAQGLEVILHAARKLAAERVRFLLIGAGPELEKLKAMAASMDLRNVRFVEKMPRAELVGLLRTVSGVVVPLRKNDLFKGAIPSKIFEALALGKPLLLGVEGEARQLFIDEGRAGLAFAPEDADDLAVRCADTWLNRACCSNRAAMACIMPAPISTARSSAPGCGRNFKRSCGNERPHHPRLGKAARSLGNSRAAAARYGHAAVAGHAVRCRVVRLCRSAGPCGEKRFPMAAA
jgi:glycosyltransferase involved in cell wall biosynthesis